MDEAWGMGTGNYLTKNGYRNVVDIFSEHLNEIKKITDKYNLEPMIWSDMYFRMSSEKDAYYDKNIVYDRYGHIGGISVFFQNDILYFEFFETEANESVITLIVKDKSTVFHTDYLLSNNDFLILYKKIMGKEVFEFPSLVNPSSEWLDKMQSDLEYENYISSIRKE